MRTHNLMILLTSTFFILTGCSNSTKQEEVGSDWRTQGTINAQGTIDNNEGIVDVLVEIKPDSAAFYRDEPEQILFDSVAFPKKVDDAKRTFEKISFDDLNGDDYSDVVVEFKHDDQSQTRLVWYWDTQERYLFQEELSYDHYLPESIQNYVGEWKLAQEDLTLFIYDDASWLIQNTDVSIAKTGKVSLYEDGIILYPEDGSASLTLVLDFEGDLVDNETGYFFEFVN